MSWFYYFSRIIVRILLFFLTRLQINGKEHIPNTGPLIIVSNHLNLVDPPLLGSIIKRHLIFMAKEELFRSRIIGYFIRNYGAFAIHRGKLDRKALHQAHQILTNGLALAIFPEGTRSKTRQLRQALHGPALIALRNNAPILPIGITGTEKIRGKAWLLHRPQITVNIGQPFYLQSANKRLTKAELTEQTNLIMTRLAELLPPEYRGIYTEESDDTKN
ncbi:MAG: lysophospholipid acyltransferase family protein [Dehalococcoidales bacterium]|nr:lysophospholipid acyltransferase family protein [Dehalococcoidales bacterium]